MRLKSLGKCESRQPPADSRDRMGFQGLQFTDSSSFASVQILEFGGLEDEEVFLFPEDLAVGDDYYPEVSASFVVGNPNCSEASSNLNQGSNSSGP
nr:hypothetical protein Iba_chr12cCG9480 [Ipomoea batatas]